MPLTSVSAMPVSERSSSSESANGFDEEVACVLPAIGVLPTDMLIERTENQNGAVLQLGDGRTKKEK